MNARKEITIAVIIGLLVGLVVVGGIMRARSALDTFTPDSITKVLDKKPPSPTPSSDELFLTLTTLDNQVLDTDTQLIEGDTKIDTYIVILGEAGEYIIVPNELGHFSQEIKLVSGANTIKVTSWQKDGSKEEVTINTIYTTAEI